MTQPLAEITKISPIYLYEWKRACVAQKMSWASGRQTSRVEDVAYSLLGLFDVNMPLLYGEGRKAFYRLQLEIIKQSDDESIFAWIAGRNLSLTGMLAPWPDAFKSSGMIMLSVDKHLRPPFAMTNKGLEMRIPESFMRQGSDDIPRRDLSGTGRVGVLNLHLACFASIDTTSSEPSTWEPIELELIEICGNWFRRAQRLLWSPDVKGFGSNDLGEVVSRLRWRDEKEITIHVRQLDLDNDYCSI